LFELQIFSNNLSHITKELKEVAILTELYSVVLFTCQKKLEELSVFDTYTKLEVTLFFFFFFLLLLLLILGAADGSDCLTPRKVFYCGFDVSFTAYHHFGKRAFFRLLFDAVS
jgi:hypothetical protein